MQHNEDVIMVTCSSKGHVQTHEDVTEIKDMFPVLKTLTANTLRTPLNTRINFVDGTRYIHIGHFMLPLFAPTVNLCYAFVTLIFPHMSKYQVCPRGLLVNTFLAKQHSVTPISKRC